MPPKSKWAFLRAWFRALAPWLEFREWPDVEKRSLRSRLRALRVYLTKPDAIQETPRETARRLVQAREALELVGLALHYDRDAWGEFEHLDVDPPVAYKHWRQFGDERDLEPRFELAFDVAHEDQVFAMWTGGVNEADVFGWDMKLCRKLLQIPAQDLSLEYHIAKEDIKALVGRAFDETYRLEIQFTFMPPRQPTARYVAQLHTFISEIHTDATSVCSRVFKLSLVHAYLHELPYMTEMAEFVEFIRRSDIQLAMASLGARRASTAGDAVKRVLRATTKPERTVASAREPRMLVLHRSDARLLKRVCAQLAKRSRIDHLVLENVFWDIHSVERNQRETKWELLGRALREPECTLKVLSLAAMLQITTADVDALKATLLAPREALVQIVTIADGAYLLLPSGGRKRVGETSLSCQIVEEDAPGDPEYMKVVVPTMGTCSVRCADIIDTSEGTGDVIPTPRLESLDVGCGSLDTPVILGLTQCFGASLRQLCLYVAFDPKIDDDTWIRILGACPQLEALSLTNIAFHDLNVIEDLYPRGGCKLQRLSLTNTATSQLSLVRFLQILSDPTHTVTRSLREMRYIDTDLPDYRSSSNRPSPTTLKALAPMLRINKTLEFLEVGLVPKLYKAHELRLRAFRNELLTGGPAGPVYREISLVEITKLKREEDEDDEED